MRSVLGTFMIFFGIYIVLYCDILGFLAEPWVFNAILLITVFVLVFVVITVLVLARKKGGENRDDKDNKLP